MDEKEKTKIDAAANKEAEKGESTLSDEDLEGVAGGQGPQHQHHQHHPHQPGTHKPGTPSPYGK